MKLKIFIISCISALIFSGCGALNFEEAKTQSQKCQTPYILIKNPNIHVKENDLQIKEDEVLDTLKILMEDECVAISQNDDAYDFDITYSSNLSTQSKENITSVAQENIAKVKITLTIKKDRSSRIFNSEQALQINGKKILGIGQNAQITDKDKQKLLQEAIKRVYLQAINSIR